MIPVAEVGANVLGQELGMESGGGSGSGEGGIMGIGNLTLKGVGMLTSALLTWYGIKKQEQASREMLEEQKSQMNIERQMHKAEFGENLKLQKNQLLTNQTRAYNEIQWKERDDKFQKQQLMANRLLNLINTAPQLKNAVFSRIGAQRQLAQPTSYSVLNPLRG
jgi:hypothetical protein